MSKAPTMPMYWDAYIADTTHLTLEQHGAGNVPNDVEKRFGRRCGFHGYAA